MATAPALERASEDALQRWAKRIVSDKKATGDFLATASKAIQSGDEAAIKRLMEADPDLKKVVASSGAKPRGPLWYLGAMLIIVGTMLQE